MLKNLYIFSFFWMSLSLTYIFYIVYLSYLAYHYYLTITIKTINFFSLKKIERLFTSIENIEYEKLKYLI